MTEISVRAASQGSHRLGVRTFHVRRATQKRTSWQIACNINATWRSARIPILCLFLYICPKILSCRFHGSVKVLTACECRMLHWRTNPEIWQRLLIEFSFHGATCWNISCPAWRPAWQQPLVCGGEEEVRGGGSDQLIHQFWKKPQSSCSASLTPLSLSLHIWETMWTQNHLLVALVFSVFCSHWIRVLNHFT